MVDARAFRSFNVFLVLFFMLALTSCSHMARHDGPPNYPVDETSVPNAVPKTEPLAKYGNMTSYRVAGKRYYVMKSSRGYDQIGTASWYGTMFHDQRTSSGERYNMLGMTAAHKTLPLPTYVEVTNLKNQRKIIVKVNDRGPFATNRIIDLSYVAAKKLGMLGHGTAYVRVKAIDPNTWERHIMFAGNAKQTSSGKHVYLQVGAFRSKSNAERLRRQLASLVSSPTYVADPSYRSSLYRVQVGPLQDVATANKISNRLRRLGIKSNKRYGV